MVKKNKYEVHEYWRNDMTATDDMAAHMNEMSAKGWEVFNIEKTPNGVELSHYPSEQACLTDGDSFSISSTTTIWYRK